MELGIGSIVYEFAGLTLNQAAERIAANGLHYVDVLAFGEYNPAFYPRNLYPKLDMEYILHRSPVL